MSHSRQQTVNLFRVVLMTIGVYLLAVGVSLFMTAQYVQLAKNGQFNAWQWRLLPVVKLTLTPLSLFPDGKVVVSALSLFGTTQHILAVSSTSVDLQTTLGTVSVAELSTELTDQLNTIHSNLPDTWLITRFVTTEQQQILRNTSQLLTRLHPLLSSVSTGKHRWLVLLQNNNELRASGGFMGSYALLSWQDGRLTEVVFEDIYDAAGQLSQLPEPPDGVREYLSDNKGWQLQDMNWAADFTSAAPTILDHFALANKGTFETIIALNTLPIKDLLEVTGPINLPDYHTQINADNFATELRTERDDFFAGSIQKKHLLSQFFVSLQQQLGQTSQQDTLKILQLVEKHLNQSNVFFFSKNPELQQHLTAQHLGNTLALKPSIGSDCQTHSQCNGLYLYLVESNVGINKANQGVDRSVQIAFFPGDITISVTTTNNNLPLTPTALSPLFDFTDAVQLQDNMHLAYVNYLRLITSSNFTVSSIEHQGDDRVPEPKQNVLYLRGDEVIETGFLAVTREKSTTTTVIHLVPNTNQLPAFITLQKQPGIESVPYTIITPQDSFEFDLTQTTTLEVTR